MAFTINCWPTIERARQIGESVRNAGCHLESRIDRTDAPEGDNAGRRTPALATRRPKSASRHEKPSVGQWAALMVSGNASRARCMVGPQVSGEVRFSVHTLIGTNFDEILGYLWRRDEGVGRLRPPNETLATINCRFG